MKKVKSFNVEEEVYKQFMIYAIKKNSSVSKEIENYMKSVLKKENK